MGNKKRNFTCHHCDGQLRVNTKIILGVETSKKQRGLILLSPRTGNYDVITHPTLSLEEGEKLNIFCSLCGKSLESQEHPGFCKLNSDGVKIYFSPIKGVQATFIERNKKVVFYGDDAKKYSSYFENIDEEHARIMG